MDLTGAGSYGYADGQTVTAFADGHAEARKCDTNSADATRVPLHVNTTSVWRGFWQGAY